MRGAASSTAILERVLMVLVLAFILGSSTRSWAKEKMFFPDSGIWGLNIHTLRHEGLKQIGVQWVRIGTDWKDVESKEQGKYDWSECDRNISYYQDRGYKVLFILGSGNFNPLYETDKKDKDIVTDAIARWMGAAAARYKGKGILWELINEPKTFPMDGYWNDPITYTTLVRKAGKEIKEADPKSIVAAMSLAWMDRDFASVCFQSGILKDGTVDLISYHGYHRNTNIPESGLAEDISWLREQIALYAPKGKYVSVIDSERGYTLEPSLQSHHWSFWRNQTSFETEQAAYLARHYIETMSQGVEVAIWYKDMSGESNFSLYTGDETTPLRMIGHVYRNLALLMPDNPIKLKNNLYTVSLVDLDDDIPAPDSFVKVRTFLKTRTVDGKKKEQLIVTAWNPIEAFEGKICDNRKRVGENMYDSWRAVSPSDKVEIPVQIRVTGPKLPLTVNASTYNICAQKTEDASKPLGSNVTDQGILTSIVNVGPIPTVVVFDLNP